MDNIVFGLLLCGLLALIGCEAVEDEFFYMSRSDYEKQCLDNNENAYRKAVLECKRAWIKSGSPCRESALLDVCYDD